MHLFYQHRCPLPGAHEMQQVMQSMGVPAEDRCRLMPHAGVTVSPPSPLSRTSWTDAHVPTSHGPLCLVKGSECLPLVAAWASAPHLVDAKPQSVVVISVLLCPFLKNARKMKKIKNKKSSKKSSRAHGGDLIGDRV